MLSVVTYKWTPTPGYRSTFGPDAVNVLRRMVARHYPRPHRFLCVTDDPVGLDPDIDVVPLWDDLATVPSPHGAKGPSCYRRLKAFSREIAEVFGPRFVSLDLDCVITGDLSPLWDRPEDFVIYGDTNPRTFYNGSMYVLTSGSRAQVWETFNPHDSPQRTRAAGYHGSDQAWISCCLGKGEATWTKRDGVYSYRNELVPNGASRLPADARVVVFHGSVDPWSPSGQRLGWVKEHYC